jgi:cytosine/creatinine deaminase
MLSEASHSQEFEMKRAVAGLANFYKARSIQFLTSYEQDVLSHVFEMGGFYNAHAHLDRADTLDPCYLAHLGITPLEASFFPLSVKQNLVGDLHRGLAYTEENLRERMSRAILREIALGVRRLDTNIDATPDLPEGGLLAIRIACELKEEYKDRITIRIAPTPIFGFREETGRWEVFKEAAKYCDYLSGLPEKDDFSNTSERNGKVGFRPALRMVLELGAELGKEVQFHLDQANSSSESGTEMLLEGLRWVNVPRLSDSEPSVWVIHMISPSTYSEGRFRVLVDQLLEHNVGVIVCPSAALSMRQFRPVSTPTHNSIARVMELIKMKVPLRLGTDNICDVFVPQSEGDMLTEIKIIGHAVRFATPSIWAKLAAGIPLNNVDIATVERALSEDQKVFLNLTQGAWHSAVE